MPFERRNGDAARTGEDSMSTETDLPRPYARVRTLVREIGGEMNWRPRGRGGDWEIRLHGKTAIVPCRDRTVNALDALYIAKIRDPKTWDDFEEDAPLVGDAFWRLVDLVRANEAPRPPA
jgi:hypothetical protein